MKGVLRWFVRLARSAGKRYLCSALAASPYTISTHISQSPSKLDRQSCWVACLLVCVSECASKDVCERRCSLLCVHDSEIVGLGASTMGRLLLWAAKQHKVKLFIPRGCGGEEPDIQNSL
jgi:hypothetical protein